LCVPTSMLPARPKKGDQSIGRSRGGLSTKIHALVDGLGMLARFHLTGGQAGDSPEALPLLGELKPASLAADKAYDSNAILQHLESTGIQAVIPVAPIVSSNVPWTNIFMPLEIWSNGSSVASNNFVVLLRDTTSYPNVFHHLLRSPPLSSGPADCQQALVHYSRG
jgi:transposase